MKASKAQADLLNGRRYGMLLGQVVDTNDPEKLGRIRVQFDFAEQVSDWVFRSIPIQGYDPRLPVIGQTATIFAVDGDLHNLVYTGVLMNELNPGVSAKSDYVDDLKCTDIFNAHIIAGSIIDYSNIKIIFSADNIAFIFGDRVITFNNAGIFVNETLKYFSSSVGSVRKPTT
jgi:Type VI secretion system/phage-baseplate injector OB domain